jgi:dTDP-4-amino-4,6-dideoxygalactose transaminase
MTDVGGVTPIIFWGCKPVICDVAKDSFNVSINEIKKKITKKTRAVIIVHVGGETVDVVPIRKYLKKRKIYLIEDCSQSHGAEIRNSKVGTFGDLSFFSTMSSKLHSTGGQGGVIYSKNKKLIDRAKSTSDRGKIFNGNNFTGKYKFLGINSNLDEVSAGIGTVQVKKLNKIIKKTHFIGEYIKKQLELNSKSMKVAQQIPKSKCVYWFIRVNINLKKINVTKNHFCEALIAEGVPMAENYDYNPFQYEWYKSPEVKGLLKAHKHSLDMEIFPKNYKKSLKNNFVIFIRESFSKRDIDFILKSLLKVERIFIR